MYVNRHTLRLVGEQIQHGPERRGYPVISQIDQRRNEKKVSYKNKWEEEFLKSGKSIQELEIDAAAASADVANLEKDVKSVKTDIENLTKDKQTLTGQDRWKTKHELRDKQMKFLDFEGRLRVRRSTKHCLNMMIKAARNHGDPSTGGESSSSSSNNNNNKKSSKDAKMTIPTLANPCTQDKAKYIDLSKLQDNKRVSLVLSGTDYGLATMSRTVPLRMDTIEAHYNRYWALIDHNEDASDLPADPTYSPLPPSFSITAPQLDSTTHSGKMREKRERKLRNDESVKAALQAVSGEPVRIASSMSEVDKAQETARVHRPTLRAFETSASRQHDQHHQELRTGRAYQKFAAAERKFVQDYGRTHRKLMAFHEKRIRSHQLTIVVLPVHSTHPNPDLNPSPATTCTGTGTLIHPATTVLRV